MERFCNNCQEERKVIPIAFLEKNEHGYVYEAICDCGRPFSPTLFGLSVVVSPVPLKIKRTNHSHARESVIKKEIGDVK